MSPKLLSPILFFVAPLAGRLHADDGKIVTQPPPPSASANASVTGPVTNVTILHSGRDLRSPAAAASAANLAPAAAASVAPPVVQVPISIQQVVTGGAPGPGAAGQANNQAAAATSRALGSELGMMRGLLDQKVDVKGPPQGAPGRPLSGSEAAPPPPAPGGSNPFHVRSEQPQVPALPGSSGGVGIGGAVLLPRDEGPTQQTKADKFVRAAKNHLNMREYRAAVAEATRALEAEPQSAEAHASRAEALYRMGEHPAGARDAQSAVDLDPKNVGALKTLTNSLYRSGDYNGALKAVQQWLKWSPRDSSAHHRKAAIYEALGDPKSALAALERAASINKRLLPVLEDAEKPGGKIRYPDDDEDPAVSELAEGGRGPKVLPLLLGVAGFLALGLSLWYARRRKSHWSDGLRSADAAAPAPPRSFADKFEMLRVLAKTPVGELIEAKDRTLERTVAVLRMPAGEDAGKRGRIAEAARAAASIRHRALVDVYEVAEDGRDVCVVAENPRGKPAAQMLREAGRFPLAQAVRLLEPVCEALEAAHGKGVFHRRLSVESLFVTDQGMMKVRDLGMLPLDPPPSDDGRRADVKGLALTLYELATGARPFAEGGQGYVPAAQRQPGLPAELDVLLQDALAPTSQPRISSAGEFLARLKGLGRPVGAQR